MTKKKKKKETLTGTKVGEKRLKHSLFSLKPFKLLQLTLL